VRHVVRGDLLSAALDAGSLTPDICAQAAAALVEVAKSGAAVVLCTCSTIGPGADYAAHDALIPVLRVDRPMAKQAVSTGSRITVAATLATTMTPTMDLLAQMARETGRSVHLRAVVFGDARSQMMAGDQDGYIKAIVDGLHEAAREADVIVLAQASMAPALAQCGDIEVPILTSPRSGLEAAVSAYRSAVARYATASATPGSC
jgi:hypothetical protein